MPAKACDVLQADPPLGVGALDAAILLACASTGLERRYAKPPVHKNFIEELSLSIVAHPGS
jgi:hypothetical protein